MESAKVELYQNGLPYRPIYDGVGKMPETNLSKRLGKA
jgi:hypothetical protein